MRMTFETDIRPMFREEDRDAMDFIFDLWNYDDVKANAELIYERIEDGSMPCDREWSPEQLATLRQWIDAGCNP